MTPAQFDSAARAFCRRRPFRSFLIEFTSGSQMVVRHPEVIRLVDDFYVLRRPDGGYVTFSAETFARVLDLSLETET